MIVGVGAPSQEREHRGRPVPGLVTRLIHGAASERSVVPMRLAPSPNVADPLSTPAPPIGAQVAGRLGPGGEFK